MPSQSFLASKLARATLAAMLVAATATDAAAQGPLRGDRWFIDVNVGRQPGARTFTEIATPIIYDETASVTTAHEVEGLNAFLDVGGGVRFGSFGAGAAYMRFDGTDAGAITARVPHPVQFNQPRTVVVAAEGLQHLESALHFYGLWDLSRGPRIGLAVFAGPSLVSVTQDIVTGVVLGAEQPPFATAPIAAPVLVERKDTAFGINIGADVAYFLTPGVGVGVTIRYVNASANLGPAGTALSHVDAGGVQFEFGARLRFR